MRAFFEKGSLANGSDPSTTEEDGDIFIMACSDRKLKAAWESCKVEVLATWIKKNPCSRPWAWWFLDAPERRQQVSGSGEGWSLGMATDSDGLPRYWQLGWDKNNPPCFESEAAFLERHGFLSSVEKEFLKKHQELLEPERIEFQGTRQRPS